MVKNKEILVFLLVFICVVSQPIQAYALDDSYVSNFSMKRELYVDTVNPNFPGTFLVDEGKVEITTRISRQTNEKQATSKYFYVDIFHGKFFLDKKVGTVKLKRSGESTGVCNKIKKGKYYFKIRKSNDGCEITGSIEIKY